MKKQIVKEFITVKRVRYLPREPQPQPPPPPPPPKRVLVVGRCTLDIITICIEPPKPGNQIADDGHWRPGDSATNICFALRHLGSDCEFLGQLSKMLAFEVIPASFQALGIDISNCPRSSHLPPHRLIANIRGSPDRTVVEYSRRDHELTYQQFVGAVDYRKYKWIHFVARNAVEMIRMVQAVRDYKKRNPDENIVLSVSLSDMDPCKCLMASLADFVFISKNVCITNGYMNGRETVWAVRDVMTTTHKRWLTKQPKKSPYITEDIPQLDPNTCTATQTEHRPILIFDSYKEGASCLMPDGKYFKVSAHNPQEIVDIIGEHDTFVGAFIYAIEEVKMSLRDAMEYATRAACLKISKYGFDGLRCMPKDLPECYYQ